MLSQAKTLRNTKFYNLSNNGFKLDILRRRFVFGPIGNFENKIDISDFVTLQKLSSKDPVLFNSTLQTGIFSKLESMPWHQNVALTKRASVAEKCS